MPVLKRLSLVEVAICVSILCCVGCATKPAIARPTAPRPAALEHEAIDAYISAFGRNWGPGYAFSGYVTVARDGKTIFEQAYKLADIERVEAANSDTRFRIGSVTKQFTAVGIVQLAQQGRLRLDDPVRAHIPELPASIDSVTLHQLLSHSSGLASYTDDEALMGASDQPHSPDEVLASFTSKPLRFTPGTQFEYSNSNYFLLGLVIQKVSGQSYEEYLQQHVLAPAGMTRTSTIDAPDAPNTAKGYQAKNSVIVPASAVDMSMPFSAGALRSTARDIVAWNQALTNDRLLNDASRLRLFTPNLGGYAYGFLVEDELGTKIQHHAGAIDGFTSFVARIPAERLVVVVLCNVETFAAARVGRPIVRMLITGKAPEPIRERLAVAIERSLLDRAVGIYTMTSDAKRNAAEALRPDEVAAFSELALQFENEHLYLAPSKQNGPELFVSDDGQLFAKDDDILIQLEPSEGPASALRVKLGELELRYSRSSS